MHRAPVKETTINSGQASWQEAFLARHDLESSYLLHAQKWFDSLAGSLSAHCNGAFAPLLVAVNGCQGSGKTTLCAYLCALLEAQYGLRALSLSLDDFYLTRAQREALGAGVHPLLGTRGVPGTHDMALLGNTLDALLAPDCDTPVPVPRFDKARDDRRPRKEWDEVAGGVDLILLEGWCLGARPQSAGELVQPINELERDEDSDGRWRNYVNAALRRDFLPLYERVDEWVMLQAPSFACVHNWRLEQEQKLRRQNAGTGEGLMTEAQLARFIQYYQRLTGHCLKRLPARVNYLYTLDEQRQITAFKHRAALAS